MCLITLYKKTQQNIARFMPKMSRPQRFVPPGPGHIGYCCKDQVKANVYIKVQGTDQ